MQHDVDFVNKLAAVRARFVSHLGEWLPKYLELQEIFDALERRGHLVEISPRGQAEPLPVDLVAPLRMQTHKIAGSALTFGFSDLSGLARELEERLEQAQNPVADLALRATLERFISAARAILQDDARVAAAGAATMRAAEPLANDWKAVEPAPTDLAALRETAPWTGSKATESGAITLPDWSHQASGKRSIHVLVVDDDELVRDLLQSGFAAMGWRMTAAASGLDAILTLFQCSGAGTVTRPDLILMDVNMPEMDGFSALERIKLSPLWRDIPIILLTRRDEDASQIRGYLVGAEDYLTKPFDLTAVIRRVSDALANRVQTVLLGCSDLERGVRLSQRLRAEGVRVKLVHSSSDAWEALCDETPAVALIDAELRGEGGMALLARARQHPDLERIPLLIGTACDEADARIAAIEAGASDGIPISLPPAYLCARIRRLLHDAKPG